MGRGAWPGLRLLKVCEGCARSMLSRNAVFVGLRRFGKETGKREWGWWVGGLGR